MSAVPPSFTPQTSFSTLAQQPILSTGLPGSELDGEFSRAADSINKIKSRLSEVQRDDGKLRNGVVSAESLSSDIIDLISLGGTNPITWAISIQIKVGDLVSNPPGTAGTYLCIVAHTSSSVFANDFANWALIAAPPSAGVLYTNTFTGNGSTTAFTLTQPPASKDNTQLYINGAYQLKSSYSINNSTLTITPAPANGAVIEISIGVPSNTVVVTVTDGAIFESKIFDEAVTTPKIATLAVTESKIASGSVSSAKLADNAVTASKIASAAVTAEKIASSAITAEKIATSAVTGEKLAPLSIAADKITSNAISTAKIQDNAITTSKVSDLTITTSKILDAAVTEPKIAANAITTPKIVEGAVTTSKIEDGAVTPEKIANKYTVLNVRGASSASVLDFEIPSWVKRIIITLEKIKTNGAATFINIGNPSTFIFAGYEGMITHGAVNGTVVRTSMSTGFLCTNLPTSSSNLTGTITLDLMGNSNTWIASGVLCDTVGLVNFMMAGTISLSYSSLSRIRLSPSNGNFTSGAVSVSYE